jgi:hypothetical protein
MLGGASIVRVVVLQESKITASATAPPAPHKKVSRLPWTHRVSLESHTNREYAQKQKIVTTHFFGRFFASLISRIPPAILWSKRDIVSAIYPKIF